jgi:flagellar hook-associated protein 3 FlgL
MLSTAASLQHLVSSIADLNQRQTDISSEMSSGLRLNSLSDDPAAAAQAVSMADVLGRDSAFLSLASSAGNRMQAADSALSSVVSQITSAITTATGALSDSGSAVTRAAAVQQLSAIRSTLLTLANSSYGGSYLFSGSGATQPFAELAGGGIGYSGNADNSAVALAGGGTVTTSLAGSSVFMAPGASVFDALDAAIAAIGGSSNADPAEVVGGLRAALENVTSQRAVLNTAQNRLSTESDYVTSQKTNLAAQQSRLLSADTAFLATELSAVTTQRSALLSTIGIVQKGSLFDYL